MARSAAPPRSLQVQEPPPPRSETTAALAFRSAMDHGGGGGRSSSRLRDRLARMFRPAALLRSTCNTTASGPACSSSTSSSPGGPASSSNHPPPPSSACSSSRALLGADSRDRDSFLASSRRDLVARTESFSTALAPAPPLPPSRFSVDAPQQTLMDRGKEKSPRDVNHHRRHRLGGVKLLSTNPYGFSTSDDDDDTDVFSSDAEDLGGRRGGSGNKKLAVGESAAETFFCSSRSFSSDSSEFYTKKKKSKKSPSAAAAAKKPPLPPSKNKPPPRRPPARRGPQSLAGSSIVRRHRRAACDTCGVRDGFRPVVASSSEEEQLRKGFAVVKRSRDPYADFRASMVEMIVGRQMSGAPDMERLLRSYLSLNAPRHHPVILQAFSDIWVVVHGG
ncbi:hypothetical protein BS78_03G008300 [Paspalum vaginatum]|nr:hypothetical protein BS78_03G008300 [Paspalum vaginatum]